jgi:AraC-like DNA-binding protein
MKRVRRLVGEATAEQLKYVDFALAREVGVFVPIAGPCGYAVTRDHAHPAFSFIVPFDDRGRVRIAGRVVRLRSGRIYGIGAGVPHEELAGDEPARYAAVFISTRLLRRALGDHGVAELPPMRGESFAGSPEIVGAIREIMVEAAARLAGSAAIVDAAGVRLVHLILRAVLGVKRRPAVVPEREAIRRAVELAEARAADPITVRDLARAADMSPFHFSREFKREMGHSPRAYVRRERLERAKRLLAAGDRPVTEVALQCGFCSASHLATAFSRAYRMPPSRYRAMMRHGRSRAHGR